MHILCPHCHNPIEVVKLSAHEEIACPSCGSSFRLETDTTTDPEHGAPQKLGRFELLEVVGRGAFGTVYKARDPELDRTVAVKVPRAGNLAGPQELDRFLREARSAAQLRHPAIVTVHEVGQRDGLPYLVSDFVPGVTLADQLSARRPGFREAAELVAAVADALQYAHEQGVVHRDVKPSNIMLGADGRPSVMDFGLAKREAGEITMTVEGQVLGTPAYMAPEQARGEGHAVDGRGDVYSLGVVLYQMLTGELPFRGTQRMLLHQVLHDEPRPPRRLNDRISRDLETVCLKAMAKEPARRYPTARDFADDLRRWLKGEPIKARTVGAWERGWRWAKQRPAVAALLGVSGVAVLALVAVVVGLFYNRELNERNAQIQSANEQLQAAKQRTEAALQAEAEARREELRFLYINKMVLAEREWSANNLGNVKKLLREAPEELRGWEWRYLDRVSNVEIARLVGHNQDVYGIAYSPDGKWLASASLDKSVKIWDAASYKEIKTLKSHKDGVGSVAFSPDGKLLVSVGNLYNKLGPGDLKFWNTTTWEETSPLQRPPDKVWAAAFHPDSRYLALATGPLSRPSSQTSIVTIWDLKTGREVHTLWGHTQPVLSMAFSPDGRRLASLASGVSRPAELIICETSTGNQLLSMPSRPDTMCPQVVFSPDGSQIAWQYTGQAVRIADSKTGQEVSTLLGDWAGADGLAYLRGGGIRPGSDLLATASAEVKLWDPQGPPEVRTLRGDSRFFCGVAVSPDGRRLAASSAEGNIIIWDPHTGHDPLTLRWDWLEHTSSYDRTRVAVSPDGKVATGGPDQTARVWDPVTGQCLLVVRHNNTVTDVAFDPNSRVLATADGHVRLWDLATGQLTRTLEAAQERFSGIAFSPDGQRLATTFSNPKAVGTARSGVKIWSVSPGPEPLTILGHSQAVHSVAFSPDGQHLVSASFDQTSKVWDVGTGQELLTLRVPGRAVRSACFSPNGRRIATASGDRASIWDASTGQEIYSVRGHTRSIVWVTFSPDGHRLATCSDDRTVKIWEAASGQELLTLRGHLDKVKHVAFSAGGQWIASTGPDCSVRIWEATPLTPERRLQREAGALVNRLADEMAFKDEIRVRLSKDRTLSEPLRQLAFTLLERHREDPYQENRLSYLIVKQPDADAVKYQQALRLAKAAELAPATLNFSPIYKPTTVLGMAQYRLAQYLDSVETLTRADAQFKEEAKRGSAPWNLAFLAMAHHQLGEKEEAQATLARLREVMKDSRWAYQGDHQTYLRQAEALIEGKAPDPKK
jgi:WD40 repeat protein/tRNA A-37 threonylcarbamoyl transferase component Bud32